MVRNVTIEISESGKLVILKASNGRIIAEILVHGPLNKCIEHAVNNAPILNGRANMFRGELYGLASYEILDKENERIIEK